jgi:DNA adenine methylase
VKAILKYPGAKNRIADWICEYIPKHDVYVEPYFGSGAIFFSKPPARIETINDMDGNVVNYFKVIRERPEELVQALRMTPYGRDEYNNSFNINKTDNEIERARKFAVRCWQGIGQQGIVPKTYIFIVINQN